MVRLRPHYDHAVVHLRKPLYSNFFTINGTKLPNFVVFQKAEYH